MSVVVGAHLANFGNSGSPLSAGVTEVSRLSVIFHNTLISGSIAQTCTFGTFLITNRRLQERALHQRILCAQSKCRYFAWLQCRRDKQILNELF